VSGLVSGCGCRGGCGGASEGLGAGVGQANYQQLILNLQFTHRIMHKLHKWSKHVLWQRFWLDLCTKQVVSARACASVLVLGCPHKQNPPTSLT